MSKKTIQNIYLIPLTGQWNQNRLREYYKKNLADLGGGFSQLHGFYFSFQSISFFALVISNFIHQLISFFLKNFVVISFNIVGSYFLEFLTQLYSIWISAVLIVWFFCIFTNDLSRESINRFLYASNQIPGHLNPRDLIHTVFKKNQWKIQKLFFYLFFIKVGFMIFQGCLQFLNITEYPTINVMDSLDRMSVFLLLILRIIYSIAKQIQSKYWWDIFKK